MEKPKEFIRISLTEDVCGFDVSTGHCTDRWNPETCIFKIDKVKPKRRGVARSLDNAVVESYDTYEEAAAGHEKYVEMIKAGKGEGLLARGG